MIKMSVAEWLLKQQEKDSLENKEQELERQLRAALDYWYRREARINRHESAF